MSNVTTGEEVATDAAIVTDKALTAVADGLSLDQTSERLIARDAIEQEVADAARAYAASWTSPHLISCTRVDPDRDHHGRPAAWWSPSTEAPP